MKDNGHVACMGELKNAYNILVVMKQTTWRSRHEWSYNIKTNLKEVGEGKVVPVLNKHHAMKT
jgi:hypothetical protein